MTTGIATPREATDIEAIADRLRKQQEVVATWPRAAILSVLDELALALGEDEAATQIEGISFLAFWLRRHSLERLLEMNFADPSVLDEFKERRGAWVKAQPAGVVAHWVAGNVPTLPIFSWVLALLMRNTSLLRVSQSSREATADILSVLAKCAGGPLTGRDLLQAAEFVWFPREEESLHRAMSHVADCRVIWGGESAVSELLSLPRPSHSTDLVFGPKYSGAILGRCQQKNEAQLRAVARAVVSDAISFDQRACSSPQTVFVERAASDDELVRIFAEEFTRAALRAPKRTIERFTATNIYQTRARYGLDATKRMACSREADWTVCLDHDLAWKEAVQSRTLFLTVVDDADSVVPLMSPRIQAIALGFEDASRAIVLADQITKRGVARCTRPGLINLYDLPWDGHMVLAELVRWVSVRLMSEAR